MAPVAAHGARARDTLGTEAPIPSSGPQQFGPFLIERELGRGGNGVVFLVRRAEGPERYALKVHTGPRDRETLIRLQLEAQVTARLEHPGIVQALDQGVIEGRDYLLMEYCEGEVLQDRLRRGALGWQRSAEVVLELARTMAAAHAKGILHRDLKPANVILEGSTGRPRIIDFGLARDPSLVRSLTQSQTVLGTPVTMAPEQLTASREVDSRADVYALGVILYWCLTGRPPFRANDLPTLAQLVLHARPDPPGSMVELPAELERVCLEAIAKSPHSRPADAGELALALERASEWSLQVDEPLPPGRGRSRPSVKRGLAVACLVAVALGVPLAFLLPASESSPVPAATPVEADANQARADTLASLEEALDQARAFGSLAELMAIVDRAEAAAAGHPGLLDQVRLARGEFLRRRGDYQGAIAVAPIHAQGEVGFAARWLKGLCLLRAGRQGDAYDVLRGLAKDDPEGSHGLDALAVLMLLSGDPSWGQVALRCGAASGPDDLHGRLMGAYGLSTTEGTEASLRALELIRREEPDEPHVFFVMAFVTGDPAGARAAYTEVLARTAPHQPAQALLGRASTRVQHEPEAALDDLDRLLAQDPTSVRAYLLRGFALLAQGKKEEAWDAWRAACRYRDPRTWEDNLRMVPPELAKSLREIVDELPR